MAAVALGSGERLFVAARGTEAEHGLWAFAPGEGGWRGVQLAEVAQLSSLCRHPSLPIVYGTGTGHGRLHGWRIEGERAVAVGDTVSGGDPCHLAVDPAGRLLVATNYGSSDLAVVPLAPDGSFAGPAFRVPLSGSGVDPERQEAAHPHQVIFHDGMAHVVDLGSDLVRRFDVAPGAESLVPRDAFAVPPGTGPRHAVFLPGGRMAIAGELGNTLLLGPATGVAPWTSVPSTARPGPARTRHSRNYPGDIQRSADGAFVYVANRSHDTVAAFDVRGPVPQLVGEVDTGVHWPQHLLVHGDHLLVAGWDSNAVAALPLAGGRPGPAERLFECPGPGWLLLLLVPA